ncbi:MULTISPECIES: S41 family peptidase [unclassified Paenibacillus]|uniref:S41 family peptidase n=1 Tax=unclassified Paenibacillus TaxID=185978 RepID=UPI000953A40C|nr:MULTISPECIES: S41 family peptidase [unclassified Paenibacillus]SIQ86332.1 carboxyl-terminal processing protease [Paenibacillus sp. RU4X]SIR07356.1 carboxyl-terminal processing protease [Paenibacillus sp. RU4T]
MKSLSLRMVRRTAALGAAAAIALALPQAAGAAAQAPAPVHAPAKPAEAAEPQSGGLSKEELQRINTVLDLIQKQYYEPVDRSKLVSGALSGMMESLGDPYSTYMDVPTAKQFSETVEGAFGGVGAEVSLEEGKLTVVSPMKGSPAERAGVQAKDVILSVNGTSLGGLPISEAVAKLRGPKGSKAVLVIQRAGSGKPMTVTVVREEIDVETVEARLLPGSIGLIEIRQFSLNTADRFAEELNKLEKRKLKGLVIDVRNNPGGILPVVEKISEPFIPAGKPILQVQQRGQRAEKILSNGKGKPYPVAVLINKGSASASEILAGALKESADAVLVGQTSFGKGTVQVSYDRNLEGGLVKMTIAKWLTPDGVWIHHEGIRPDIQVKPPALYTVSRLSRSGEPQRDAISEDTKSLQAMLAGLGYKPGRTDGYYSEETAAAVKAFQRQSGLRETGSADPATQEKLEQAVREWVRSGSHDTQLEAAAQALRSGKGARKP